MPTLSSRTKWLLGITGSLLLIAVLLVQTVPFVGMAWGALTGGPGLGVVRDMRGALLQQDAFRQTLVEHEQEAVRRYRASGSAAYQRRHLVRVNLTPLGLPGFHDVFAVRMRTDVVDGVPKTAFLARPGVVASDEDAPFFTRQCASNLCKQTLRAAIGFGHALIERGILTTYRLNITESDATSRVTLGPRPMSTATWARETRERHRSGQGRPFGPGS
jgi:hypothetical protein